MDRQAARIDATYAHPHPACALGRSSGLKQPLQNPPPAGPVPFLVSPNQRLRGIVPVMTLLTSPTRSLALIRTCVFSWLGLAVMSLSTLSAAVIPFTVTLDTNASTAQVTLDALGKSDTQTSRLGGTVQIVTDDATQPTQAGLKDFHLSALQPLNFNLSFGFLGGATAKIPKFEVVEAAPPSPPSLLPLVGGHFIPTDIPYQPLGNGSYVVSGAVCGVLSGQQVPVPCADTLDFSHSPPGSLSELDMELTVHGGLLQPAQLQIKFSGFFSLPLDPTNPSLGTVSAFVDAVGYAPTPPESVALEAQITPAGRLLLRWPRTLSAAALWSSPSVTNPAWSPVATLPALKGNVMEVELPLPPGAGKTFFSLR